MLRVIQIFEGQIISLYHPGNHVITTLSHRRNLRLLQIFLETGMKPELRYVNPFVKIGRKPLFLNSFTISLFLFCHCKVELKKLICLEVLVHCIDGAISLYFKYCCSFLENCITKINKNLCTNCLSQMK